MMITLALCFLGTLGFLISLYFALVYYSMICADQAFIPALCRLDESTCQRLIRRPEAHLFGFPNCVAGLIYYPAVVAAALLPPGSAPWYERAVLFAGGGALSVGLYLSYLLLARLRTNCVLCFASHVVNACLFLLLLVRTRT